MRSRQTSTASSSSPARARASAVDRRAVELTITSWAPAAGGGGEEVAVGRRARSARRPGVERREAVREGAHAPAGRVGRAAVGADRVELRRGQRLVALGERVARLGVAALRAPGATIVRSPDSGSTRISDVKAAPGADRTRPTFAQRRRRIAGPCAMLGIFPDVARWSGSQSHRMRPPCRVAQTLPATPPP